MQEIMTFLGAYGVTLNKAKKIQKHFGSRSVDVIQHSPYLLCEISGFGFKTVDQIARNINFLPADPLRLENGILFILEEAKDGGDLFLMQDILLERAYVLLSEAVPKGEVTETMIKIRFRIYALTESSMQMENGFIYRSFSILRSRQQK